MEKSGKKVSDFPNLLQEWHWEKNGDLKPSEVAHKSHKKVWWKCSTGIVDHEWEASPDKRTSGNGCPCCSRHKVVLSNCLATTHPEIAKQWHPIKNGELTPFDVAGGKKKIWWKCPIAEDHEWMSMLIDRLQGYGCPCCYGLKVVLSNCLATVNPELAKQWHPIKNGELTPFDVIAGGKKEIWWKCPVSNDHEWMSSLEARIRGNGCACCHGLKVVLSNCLATTHPEIAKQWHPTKNGNLTPNDVVAGGHKKVWWKCSTGIPDHEWQSAINNRTSGKGCPCCSRHKVVLSNCLATTNPELAKQWHPTKNGYLTPHDVVGGKVWWKCFASEDHEWEAEISNRIYGNGCPCCMNQKVVLSNCLATVHPELAKQWHPTKNGELTPFDVVAKSGKKVWWKCLRKESHVSWKAAIVARSGIQKSGCPSCSASKGEKGIESYLNSKNIIYKPQWRQRKGNLPKRLRFDFAVKRNGQFWLIEYHGKQHYVPVGFGSKKPEAKFRLFEGIVERDEIKENWCRENGANLFVIPYWEFDRLNEILDIFFSGQMPVISEAPEEVQKYDSIRNRMKERQRQRAIG